MTNKLKIPHYKIKLYLEEGKVYFFKTKTLKKTWGGFPCDLDFIMKRLQNSLGKIMNG